MERVIIIGGGVSGLCSAYYLNKKGYDVTIIDKTDITDGCSYGNAGLIVPSHIIPLAAPGMVALGLKWMFKPGSPFYIKPRLSKGLVSWSWKFYKACTQSHVDKAIPVIKELNLESKKLFQSLSGSLEMGLEQKGLMMYSKTSHGLEEEKEVAKMASKHGIETQVMSAKEIQDLEPSMQLDIKGGVFYPGDAHITPNKFIQSLISSLKSSGVKFVLGATVDRLVQDGGRIVSIEARNETIAADKFLITGGAWSDMIAQGLEVNMPMQAGKGYSMNIPSENFQLSTPAILTEARVAVTPMESGIRFAGTMEIAGLDHRINALRVKGIQKAAQHYFPQIRKSHFDNVSPWAGLRPCSPDGLPYIGQLTHYDNLYTAAGHAMMGLSLGPITGKLITEIMSREKTSINTDMLHPDRYN